MFLLTSTSDVLVAQMSFAPLENVFLNQIKVLSFLQAHAGQAEARVYS